MNRRLYRLVFSRVRGMLVAVEETAAATGKKNEGETAGAASTARQSTVRFALRHTALGVWVLAGTMPLVAHAQVVADPNAGAHQPTVIQTANGIQQVNITRPSGAGVSINGYTQFDVPKAGVILNNSPTIVQTQQAGYVNGNANLLPGQAAKIIINQVNSNSPSQLRGYVEVAGSRAEVVIANSSGLIVDGAGFINTSRGILTTGTPLIGANGNLTGFNVTAGQITVQGAGLNAANVDQVDLIARAVAVNASIYANNLNVVTGANQVDHDTLATTAIAGNGAAPGVSIDVSELGGMYANRIRLVGTENGVGVSLRGVTAAQAGDLTLTTQGKLVMSGKANASGNISLTAQGGVDNSGTVYGQQAVAVTTAGGLANSGTLAAQQGLNVSANNVTSTGTLGAGINADGSVGAAADMSIVAASTLSATGRNTAAGNASLQAGNISLAGSQTGANGNVTLSAQAGNLDLTGATVSAGGSLDATAQGALTNNLGSLTSQGALALQSGGAFSNAQGMAQAAGALKVLAGSLDNTAGRVVSLNSDGLTITSTGALTNITGTTAGGAAGGVIGGNGAVQLNAGALTNHGQISAQGDARIRAQTFDNASGSTQAGGKLDLAATGALSNTQGTLSAADTLLAAGSLDNGAGKIEGNHVGITASGGLSNRAGTITQFGTSDTTIVAGGLLDNTSGSIASNGANLKVDVGSLKNDNGGITHAGQGTFTLTSAGGVSNANGNVGTNGDASISVQGVLDNTSGTLHAGNAMSVSASGDISNRSGLIESAGAHAALTVSGANVDNTGGRIANAGDGATSVSAQSALTNGTQGFIGGNGDVSLSAATLTNAGKVSAKTNAQATAQRLTNDAGSVLANGDVSFIASGTLTNRSGTLSAGGATTLNAASIDNSGGKIEGTALALTSGGDLLNASGSLAQYGTTDQQIQVTGKLDNTSGTIASNGTNLGINAGSLVNDAGQIKHAGSGTLTISSQGAVSNANGSVATNGALSLTAASLANHGGRMSAQGNATLGVSGALDNTRGTLHAGNSLDVAASGDVKNIGGLMEAAGMHGALTVASVNVDNTGGRIANAGDDTTRVTAQGDLTNGAQGFIGGNGDVSLGAGNVTNAGTVSAKRDTDVTARTINNNGGSLLAGNDATVTATGAFTNRSGTFSAGGTGTVHAGSIDNTTGSIDGTSLSLISGGDLINAGGSLTQYGATDQRIQVTGKLDNTAGTIASNAQNLALSAATLVNDRGTMQHAGTGSLGITTTGAMSNVGGKVGTNGTLNATVASLGNTGSLTAQQALVLNAASDVSNRGGALYGQNGLSLTTHGQFDNTGGSAQTAGDLSVQADGALTNAQGTLSANGAHGTVNVSAASVDNSSGHLINAGDGATTVSSAGAINNAGGTLGGNGDVTINASDLTNTSGAQLVAGGTLNANVTRSLNNAGGRIYGGTALTINQTGATLWNDGGTLLGGRGMSMKVALFSNQGGVVRANQDIGASGAISGDGEMTAGRNLTLNVAGDYTNSSANHLHADGDMALNASGTLTNTGTLGASGALTLSGANVVNAAGADINSASTTVNASGTLNNAGRIEGDTVRTNSALLANTGTVIGNVVQVNANDVQNSGPSAVIAAAQDLKIYAANSVSNADGALIYSAGNLEIARDGTRDGSGLLANQMNVLTNSAADIEADGNLDIAARTVNNVRTGVSTQAGTPQTTSTSLTLWTAGLAIGDMGIYRSQIYPEWTWTDGAIGGGVIGHLANPITATVPISQVTNLDTTARTFSLTQPLTDQYYDGVHKEDFCPNACRQVPSLQTRQIATNVTQYYNSITDKGNGTYAITFWPDYDPNRNIRPDQVKVRTDLGTDSHDYVETQRSATTATSTDQLLNPGNAATIRAQGAIRINADGGSINNQSSTMSAGGNLVRRANGGSVNDNGIVLQQSVAETDTSTFYWHQKTGSSDDTKTVQYPAAVLASTTVDALPAIATSNQSVVTDAQTINVTGVNRLGQTVTGSGVTGGNANGTQLGAAQGAANQAQTVQSGATVAVAGLPGQTGDAVPFVGAARAAIAALPGQSAHPQTLGGASGGIPNLKLPTNGLYTLHTAPAQPYLVATDPRFTQYNNFISSDYMLNALDLDPSKVQKRLGDGAYEEKLVRDQVTQLTGRTFLAGYSDNMDEYKALMNSGVAYSKQFGLTPGIGLSDVQMHQLTTDMVWLVSQDVTLPDGTHQSVLVPKLYLAQADTVDLQHTGALVAGNTVSLNATGDVNNTGHIVSDVATQILGNTIVNSGVIGSTGTTVVQAVQDVRNLSGRIGGKDVVVSAGRDVVNETVTIDDTRVSGTGGLGGSVQRVTSTGVEAVASISATGNVQVAAGRDLTLTGARIEAGNSAALGAGRDLNVGAQTLTTSQDVQTADGLNYGHDQVTQHLGSGIVTGGDLLTVSGRDTALAGSNVVAGGNASLIAGGNLTETATKDTHTHSEASLGGEQSQYTKSSYDETATGSSIQVTKDATLAAGQASAANALLQSVNVTPAAGAGGPGATGNVEISGSTLTTRTGAANLLATGNVTVGAVTETHNADSWAKIHHSGFLDEEKSLDTSHLQASTSVGSTVSADSVNARAGQDLTIAGSTVAATNDVSLVAGHNLTIGTTQDTRQSNVYHEASMSGIGANDGISYGSNAQRHTGNDRSTTQTGSMVGSTNGSVSLSAGDTLHITGSNVLAAKDISGTAASVIVDSAVNTQHHDESLSTKSSGLTLGMTGGIVSAVEQTSQESNSATKSQDSRAAVLHGMAAARGVYDIGSSVAGASSSNGKQNPFSSVGAQLSWGINHSQSSEVDNSTTNAGSNLSGGGNVSLTATGRDGQGNATGGNLDVIGSSVSGNNVALKAANQVNLLSTQDTSDSHSTNQSSSTSLAVSYSYGNGWGGSGSFSRAHGNSSGESATQNNTHITAQGTASIVSQGDTTLRGATVTGNTVTADVGGNLNLESLQDTQSSSVHQQSMSGSASYSQYGGGSGSFSAQNQNGSANYASVVEQTGIAAGSGGFDINVRGNTDLKGATIASTARADSNRLTTGTLTFSDIGNHADYSASTMGISGSMSMGGQSGGNASGKPRGGILPAPPQNASGSQDSITRSAVSDGSIVLTNGTGQTQDLASLSRNTDGANTVLNRNPDINRILGNQADVAAAASAAAEAVAKTIGDIATAKKNESDRQLDAAKRAYAADPSDANRAALDAAQATADSWADNGLSRAALHGAGAALVAGLGGGNAIGAALGTAGSTLASAATGKLANDLANQLGITNPDANSAITTLVNNVLSVGIGAVLGGGSGASGAANADLYNRQLHQSERDWAKDNAKKFADFYARQTGQAITTEQAENMLLANGYRLVDDMASKGPGGNKYAVAFISENAGNLFTATAAERADPGALGGSLSPEQKALPGHTASPALGLGVAGLMTGGALAVAYAPELASLISSGAAYAMDLFAAYRAAQANYSLATAALTGAGSSAAIYTLTAAALAAKDSFSNGSAFFNNFDEKFSLAGLAVSSGYGAASSMFGTQMYNWAGVPNSIKNLATAPGIVTRINSLAVGQTLGRAIKSTTTNSSSNN